MLKNKDVDAMLKTLRKHSPDWIDRIRRYIKALEKDYVIREDYDKLKKEIRELNNSYISLEGEFTEAEKDHDCLDEEIKQLKKDNIPIKEVETEIIKDVQVCVCPECHWQYGSDIPFQCENEDCKRHGKKGIMCWVIPKDKIKQLLHSKK